MLLSIMGMYEYDPSIFDGLDIPSYTDDEGQTYIINKNTVINNICLKCAELELLYSRPDTMKLAISVWSEANQEPWRKLIETQYIKFNPIWNVDAYEKESYNRDYNDAGDYDSNDTASRASEDKRSVQGFNSDTWAEAEKTESSGSDSMNRTAADSRSGHENSGTEKVRQGNIGVTASQDLILKQRSIAEFNIIDHIADSFKKRFCLMVY